MTTRSLPRMGDFATRTRLLLAFAEPLLGARVDVLFASRDAELAGYMKATGALAAQCTEAGGRVSISLNDTDEEQRPQLWGAFLEEVAHALQNRTRGDIVLSVADEERNTREVQVAECMLSNVARLKLTEQDVEHYETALTIYSGPRDGS